MKIGVFVFSIFMVCGIFSSVNELWAKTSIPIDRFLHNLGIAPTEPLGCGAIGFSGPMTAFEVMPGFSSHKLESVCRMHGHDFMAAICREATYQCRSRTGDDACWAPALPRFRSPGVRKQVFLTARSIFESIRNNPQMANQCCDSSNNPEHCQQAFQNVRFNILTGLRYTDETCEYRYAAGILQMSEGMLLACRDISCISTSILHEFGHACAYARLESEQDRNVYRSGVSSEDYCLGTQQSVAQSHKMFDDIFGQGVFDCVSLGIKSRPRGCFATRLQEAFADGVFMNHRTNLSQYAWDCDEREDSVHAKPISYESCFIDRPDVRRHICP